MVGKVGEAPSLGEKVNYYIIIIITGLVYA